MDNQELLKKNQTLQTTQKMEQTENTESVMTLQNEFLESEKTAPQNTETVAPSVAVNMFRKTTEKNMPDQLNDLNSSVKERLQQEKERQKNNVNSGNNATVNKKEVSYDELQNAFWKTVRGFHNTAEVNTAMGVKYAQYNDMDLFALRDELKSDKGWKSSDFKNMFNSVNDLLNLAETDGKAIDEKNKEVVSDFNEVFFAAKIQVNQYIKLHSGFRFTKKGDRRVQIALRLQTLLKQLEKEREKTQDDLMAKKIRMAGYESEGLSGEEIAEREKRFNADQAAGDLLRLMETGNFVSESEKEGAKKAGGTWIEKGYTKDLKKMIEEQEVGLQDKERQNEFLAFLVDEENRKVANRMAISVLLDSSKDATLGMPWLKKELNDHLAKKLKGSVKEKTPEFLKHARQEIEAFKQENKDKIAGFKDRLSLLGAELNLPLRSENLFDNSVMKEILTENNEESFNEKLQSVKEHIEANDKIISDILKERFSVKTRSSINEKIIKYFGALRISGTEEQIYDQTNAFCDMLKFTAPAEFVEEQNIKKVMDDNKIDELRKDSFVLYMTNNAPEKFFDFKNKAARPQIQRFTKNIKENSKAFDKIAGEKGQLLTKEQWDALEELQLKNGEMDNKVFMHRIEEIRSGEYTGQKFSRNEYVTERKFLDEQKVPKRMKHAKAEQEKIDRLGHSMDKKFFTVIAFNKDPMEKFRELDKAFMGKTKEAKAEKEAAEALRKERINHVNHVLQRSGIPKDKWPEHRERFDRLIDSIIETDSSMAEDERLAAERMNLERCGVRTWNEALEVLDMLVPQLVDGGSEELDLAKEQFEKSRLKLSEYDKGKYADFADVLLEIPEVYIAMMNEDEKSVDNFLKDTLDKKLKGFIDGLGLAGTTRKEGEKGDKYIIPAAIRKQYAYTYLRNIYEGGLSGDAKFFEEDISNYNERVFKIKPKGVKTIADNIKAVERDLEGKIFFKWKKSSEALPIRIAVLARIYEMTNNTEDFIKLLDLKELKKFAREELDRVIESVKKNESQDEAQASIVKKFEDKLPATKDKILEKREEIAKEKEKGTKDRQSYLATDTERIEKVRFGKSLVRVQEKGLKAIAANDSQADKMRGKIEKYCSAFELPPVLRDALVEEGVGGDSDGIIKDSSKLKEHAFSMSKLYNLLTKSYKDDPAMSDEEACMYIVNLYTRARDIFEKSGGPDVAWLRNTADYADFRKIYKELSDLENDDSGDAEIERERAEISKDLRVMIVTRVGVLNDDGESIQGVKFKKAEELKAYNKRMLEVAKRNRLYLNRSADVRKLIRQTLVDEDKKKERKSPDHYLDRMTFAVLQYFMSPLVDELKKGKEFDESAWKKRINDVYNDKPTWDNMVFRQDRISSDDYKEFEEQKYESTESEEKIANAINDNASKDQKKAYDGLDMDQKKLFSLALMMMDLGSIGYGTEGTTALLNSKAKKPANLNKVQEALNKYVSGEDFNFEINYKEAFNKLFRFKEVSTEETDTEDALEETKKKIENKEGFELSETAFDKAMQFAKEITAKKLAFGEKDWIRLDDGYSSINTAGIKYGKEKQLEEVDRLRGQFLSVENVREKMLEYVKLDDKRIIHNLSGIRKRFESMTADDLKLFLRIMQDRSVLDVSEADDGSGEEIYVDHERRNALREALSADMDTRASVMKGFDDPESCFQVLVNALSFQLRDDINSTGKDLTKDNFKDGALDRKTLADWDLIERAFDFMDEIKEKRTAVYALSHATNYIDQSGNDNAIIENKKFVDKYKKKEDFSQDNFEEYIKEQATKDKDEDIRRVVAGYHSLTDKEKNLFFKVLARRDLLDISKKNYKSSFFGKGERNFVNQAERDKLIDKYIESSLEDNIGITLDEGAYYDAMQSLFTTQINDSEKLSSDKSIKDLTAAERNLFMLRDTAVDWKLFKRALNFVNRASEELEYAEGNAQLYRGAGNLVDNGRLDMNYSFLRKNFHRTGNQWGRYFGNLFARKAKEVVNPGGALDILVKGVGYADIAAQKIGLRRSGSLRKGLKWIKDKSTDANEFIKNAGQGPQFNINAPEVKKDVPQPTKEELEAAEQEEKERRENLNYYGHIKDGIDNVFAQGREATDAIADTYDFVKEEISLTLSQHFESMQSLIEEDEIKAEVDKDNIVEKTLSKGNKEKTSGDGDGEKKAPKIAGPKAKEVVKLFQDSAEKAVYGFLNDNFINAELDEEGDELEQLKKAAEDYKGDDFEQKVKEMIGEENAKKLLDAENSYYGIKEEISGYIKKTVDCINYAKKCVKHVENIGMSIQNMSLLSSGEKSAKSKREEDDKKLEKAGEKRLSSEQSEKAKNIVDKHRGMTGMTKDLGMRLEGFNIAQEAINLSMETASFAGGKLNVGQEVISKAIQEGLQFALFALRVASDRNVLAQYFLKTDAGKAVVDKVRNGFIKSGDTGLADDLDKSIKLQEMTGSGNFIDILSDARAYEHTSELVENTAMSMAQSIVFCASNYNPMAETRLMAITVMSVMGMDKEIGSIEPQTVERLFNKFKMSR